MSVPKDLKKRAEYLAKLLKEDYPEVRTPLNHTNEFELLLATILSAQTTDALINKVTPALFKKYPTPEILAIAEPEEVDELIKRVNYHRTKAKNLVKTAQILLEKFNGRVPHTLEQLTQLAGVGRKVANVVINQWFHAPEGFVVDTHILRVAKRFGLTEHTDATKVEQDLMKLFPKKEWDNIALRMIFHGREMSQWRNPDYVHDKKWSTVYAELDGLGFRVKGMGHRASGMGNSNTDGSGLKADAHNSKNKLQRTNLKNREERIKKKIQNTKYLTINTITFNLYTEGNVDYPELPTEDAYANSERVFIVADGVTHDLVDGKYPDPSEAGIVARLVCEAVVQEYRKEELKMKNESKKQKTSFGKLRTKLQNIRNAFQFANLKVKKFNKASRLYENRERNSYTIGAAVTSAVFFNTNFNELTYAVLDDCSVRIFRKHKIQSTKHRTLQLKPYALNLTPHVYNSAKVVLLDDSAPYKWDEEGRKFWRKNVRNHKLKINGHEIGYGAIDGREGYEQFLQIGKVKLKKGDLVLVYSDGFEKAVDDPEFLEIIQYDEESLHKKLKKYFRKKKFNKEKTAYIIEVQ